MKDRQLILHISSKPFHRFGSYFVWDTFIKICQAVLFVIHDDVCFT
jgi:hypothetical protein